MLLDSMMKSSILAANVRHNTDSSFMSDSAHQGVSDSQFGANSNMVANSTQFVDGQQSMLNASLNSASSSVYYDAASTHSYMLNSVNEGAFEGAFEPSPNVHQR